MIATFNILLFIPGLFPQVSLDLANWQIEMPWVFLLLPLPLISRFFLPAAPVQNTAVLRIPFFQGIHASLHDSKPSRSLLRIVLAILAWVLLLTAAARPQQVGETVNLPLTGRSLMMAVDISGSMQITDMVISNRHTTRLNAVKMVAGDFISKREGDRIGLILFGSQAYLQAPLTFDRKTVKTLLNEAELGLAGRETAMGDAIGLAVKRLRNEPEKNRVLVLLTDGANTAGNVEPLKAADLAAQEKVRIYTIGVGAEESFVKTPFGMQRTTGGDLDEATLKAIAEKTAGRYFRARNVESLSKIYALLDEIEPVSKDDMIFRPVKEMYYYPLALALLLSILIAIQALITPYLSVSKTAGMRDRQI